VYACLCGGAHADGHPLMPPTGPEDRKDGAWQGGHPEEPESTTAPAAPDEAPRDGGRSGLPPGFREESQARGEMFRPPNEDAYPPGYGDATRPAPPDRAYPPPSSPPAPRYDRFGWPVPEENEASQTDQRPVPPVQGDAEQRGYPPSDARPSGQESNPRDTSSWRLPPTPGAPPRPPYSGQFTTQESMPNQQPRGGYSGQFPVQPPPQQSGAFPAARNDERQYRESAAFPITPPEQDRRSGPFPMPPPSDATRSGQFPAPPPAGNPDDRRSGQFPLPPANPVYQSGAYAVPPESGTSGYAVTASGPIPQSPSISGPLPRVGEQPEAMRRSGPFPYPGEVTSTGSRRVIVAPDAGVGSLLADRPALAFLLAAVVVAGAMVAYIAARYGHFPSQIALHFGPAGSSQPTRIGDKRELWTIPFIVGIVLAANTALAWAVYRYDRFAARLLTLGSALIAAIAWVVLLTLLHR
jgi:hypothetical protein